MSTKMPVPRANLPLTVADIATGRELTKKISRSNTYIGAVDMPEVQEAAEQATFWVSFGSAAGLVGVTAAATAFGAFLTSRAMDRLDPAALEEMERGGPTGQQRRRLTLEEAEQRKQQQQRQDAK